MDVFGRSQKIGAENEIIISHIMLKIIIQPEATKELLKIPKKIRLNILDKISELEKMDHPLQHRKVKKLRGRKFEEFRLRVGDYRIKFILADSTTIKIIHAQHRGVGY